VIRCSSCMATSGKRLSIDGAWDSWNKRT
jgi:hypothetical protein